MIPRALYETPRVDPAPGEAIFTSTCGHNCGGRCVVNAHVREDRIVKISTDPRRWTPELPPLHACVRGFGQGERVNHPDRLRYPLRRVGPRGSGRFERIDWDEALDKMARWVKDARDDNFTAKDDDGNTVNRQTGFAFLGGATISNEEGYLAAKLMRGLGTVYLEQQARV